MRATALPNAPHIRRAAVSDAPEIARLAHELGYPATEGEMASRLHTLQPLPTHFIAVAEGPRSRLLGWVAAERRMLLESGEQVEIVGLVVDANHRRTGVGKRLVYAVEQWAASQGVATLSVSSNIARSEAHPFYERMGYVPAKTRHAYVKRLVSG
jgi:GNAT superfamily N-acetyltransferase